MDGIWKALPEKNPVKLWDSSTPGYDLTLGQDEPTLTPYLLGGQGNGCVIVFPGGGYQCKALHESEPVALAMNGLNLSAFVLDYRVQPYRHPVPMMDARRAVRHVRHHAQRYGINPNAIAVLGFSAGGHLAASAGVFWEGGNPASADLVERVSSRPDAMVLCYPVIDMAGPLGHEGSAQNLLGEGAAHGDLRRSVTPSLHVTPETPPAFLWHTADDQAVPAGNSITMFSALRNCGIVSELHIFPAGPHGMGLAAEDSRVSRWVALCGGFLKNLGF